MAELMDHDAYISRSAALIQRLLSDSALRAEFRRNPGGVCRQHELPQLADQLAGQPRGMLTVEVRESRSSLAGVMMAAAAEGIDFADLAIKAAPHAEHDVADVLDRVSKLVEPQRHHELRSPHAEQSAAPSGGAALGSSAETGTPSPAPGQEQIGVAEESHQQVNAARAQSAGAQVAVADPGRLAALTGGTPAPHTAAEVAALLANPHLTLAPSVRELLVRGDVDPRLVAVLTNAACHHELAVSDIQISVEPVHAQAIDIVSVDGQRVGPSNMAARDLITELAALEPSERPSEIGTPWAIRAPGFYTDPASSHLHLGFASLADYRPAGASNGAPETAIGEAGGSGARAHGAGGGVAAALAYARSMLGKLPESEGENVGPALNRYEAEFGFHGAPWCGIFAGHVLEAAGLKVPHTVASVADILELASNGEGPFEKGILPVSAIRPGDLVTFGGTEHVAVVMSVDGEGIHTIAGNTGQNNVSETTYSPSEVTGVVRPRYGDSLARAPEATTPGAGSSEEAAEVSPGASGAPIAYPGDSAPKAQIAGWMGQVAQQHGLPRELPVMAALVESSLHNDPSGDRDSVGYFQMRTGIWDNGPYAGFANDPALQLKWFIDQALAVKREHEGDPTFGKDPSSWGEWVADVERPAEQYRGRYQAQLEAARGLLREAIQQTSGPPAGEAATHVPPHFARALPVVEATPSGATVGPSGYALPTNAEYLHRLGHTTQGVKIESAPGGAVIYSITPGVVSTLASGTSGAGRDYPVIEVSRGSLAGQYIYYAHVGHSLVKVGQHVAAGQPIAIIGSGGEDASALHSHIEIGFSNADGEPLERGETRAGRPAVQRMHELLVSLAGGVGIMLRR